MKILFAILFFVLSSLPVTANGTLILLIDISASLGEEDMDYQLKSYADVLRNGEFLDGVNIEILLFSTEVTHLSSGDRRVGAAFLDSYPRSHPKDRGMTCMLDALRYTLMMIPELPQPVVLDIGGDGESNCGTLNQLHSTLDSVAETGTIVNTLYYQNEEAHIPDQLGPIEFYKSLTRNFGFSMMVTSISEFSAALKQKIVLEVADLK